MRRWPCGSPGAVAGRVLPCHNGRWETIVLSPDEVDGIANLLDDRLGLDALWVFGSFALGAATAASDVDLAALFHQRPSPIELIERREAIARLLGWDVDLMDVVDASPILAMQVLRHGRLLADRHPRCRLRFVASVAGRYEDLKIARRGTERALFERVRRGRP